MSGTRTANEEPPRSTAYYYADLERIKRKNLDQKESQNPPQLSEYVESTEVINDGPIREVPPLRDRQFSLPEYHTPENSRKGETYSTAGTFPMPEPKEKEPLLAELEVVGRLPLTQLESGVTRSRSWYLCCPNLGEEEISRESSWRYSSLRPVTAPPLPGQNGISGILVATSSSPDDVASLRAERDALARSLAAERQRAATVARAHDARLAELHGVIAELVRRRAADKQATAIPEEEVSDECESTTQPAGELESTSQPTSPDLATPPDEQSHPCVRVTSPVGETPLPSERESDNLSTARCSECEMSPAVSCARARGSPLVCSATGSESRQAKMASRVKLKRTDDDTNKHTNSEKWWREAEKLSLDVCAQADLREALLTDTHAECPGGGCPSVWAAKCARLQADVGVLQCALARATDTAHRLQCACSVQESWCVSLCLALRAADRALETYDVLLALAESTRPHEVSSAQLVARQLLWRLERECDDRLEPLLSPGPWTTHTHGEELESWSSSCELRLRAHAARLKSDTARHRPPRPALFSHHDIEEAELAKGCGVSMDDMEAAVTLQELLAAREASAGRDVTDTQDKDPRRGGHWLDTAPSETEL